MKILTKLVIVLVIVVVLSGCSAGVKQAPFTAEAPTQPAPTRKPAVTPTAAEEVDGPAGQGAPLGDVSILGEITNNMDGGFGFRVVPGYDLNISGGMASMLAPGADPDTGPVFQLMGWKNEQKKTNQQLYDELISETPMTVSASKSVPVSRMPGLWAEITGDNNGKPMKGRVVMAMVTEHQQFVMMVGAPESEWDTILPYYEAVLASIELFDLVTPPAVSGLSPGMYHYTNANVVRDIVVQNGIAYTATLGGMVAWNLLSGYDMQYTPLDGMSHVSANSVTVCQIPETRVIVGTLTGLSYYDPSTGLWEERDLFPAGSSVNTSKINRVYCDQANQRLLIGYNGLGVLDLSTGAFEQYTQKEGLAWGEVTDITVFEKDIYIASGYKGIARISSGQVTAYTAEKGMPDERAHSIEAAKDGTIWVGASTGIQSFKGGKWTLYGSDKAAKLSDISEIEISAEGKIWAATSPFGTGRVCQFNTQSGACDVEYKDAESQPILALALDENGYPVYGTSKGLYAYDGEQAQAFKTGEELQTNFVDSFAVTSTGKLWVGTDGGVQVLDTADPSRFWDTYTKVTTPGLSGNWAKAIALGPDDTTWVAMTNGEASRYQNGEWSTLTGLQSYETVAVDSQGRAWFGDDGKGIVVLNSDGSPAMTFTAADGLPSDKVLALEVDDQDTVWIGTDSGLAKFERETLLVVLDKDSPRLINKYINNLVLAQDGSLIIGTFTGVMRLNGDHQLEPLIDFLKDGYSHARLTELAVAPNGRLWVGTTSGLLYSDDMASWTMLTTADGLMTNYISALAVDIYGAVWVGGGGSNFDGGGLLHIVP